MHVRVIVIYPSELPPKVQVFAHTYLHAGHEKIIKFLTSLNLRSAIPVAGDELCSLSAHSHIHVTIHHVDT